MSALNRYVFKHYWDGRPDTTVYTEDDNCTEIVRRFVHFLMGVSFHKDTILNALMQVASEMGHGKEE